MLLALQLRSILGLAVGVVAGQQLDVLGHAKRENSDVEMLDSFSPSLVRPSSDEPPTPSLDTSSESDTYFKLKSVMLMLEKRNALFGLGAMPPSLR